MSIYDELDEFLATESGAEYTTEAVVGLKAWKAYFTGFKKEYATHFAAAKKADRAGDKKKFDAEIKACDDIINGARDSITNIEENGILNVICPLMCSWLWFAIKLVLDVMDLTGDPNKKNIGNGSKIITLKLLDVAQARLSDYKNGYSKRHETTTERVSDLEAALLTMVNECGEITADEYDAIRSFYEAAEEADKEDDADDSDDEKDDADDSDDEKDAKLSKKAQEVMDAFNDLSDKDQETVKSLMQEHADDADDEFLSYFEAAVSVVMENSDDYVTESTNECDERSQTLMHAYDMMTERDQNDVKALMVDHTNDADDEFLSYFEAAIEVVMENSDYYTESAIDTFDCPEFDSFT